MNKLSCLSVEEYFNDGLATTLGQMLVCLPKVNSFKIYNIGNLINFAYLIAHGGGVITVVAEATTNRVVLVLSKSEPASCYFKTLSFAPEKYFYVQS